MTKDNYSDFPIISAKASAASPFYSKLRRLLETKMPTRMKAQALRSMIDPGNGSGVNSDEIKWSGLDSWLAAKSPDEIVEKEAVLAALTPIDIEEVLKEEDDGSMAENWWNDEGGAGEETPWAELGQEEQQAAIERYLDEVGVYSDDSPKFERFQVPGGENYKEILLTLPMQSPEDSFKSRHFREPNILAHIRSNTRTDIDGRRMLFVEEVQSDWHQQGRTHGYKGKPIAVGDQIRYQSGQQTNTEFVHEINADGSLVVSPYKDDRDSRAHIIDASRAEKVEAELAVMDAPFANTSKGWAKLSMRHVIKMAVEGGYDRIGWTTGKIQSERYDLSSQIDGVTVHFITNPPEKAGWHWSAFKEYSDDEHMDNPRQTFDEASGIAKNEAELSNSIGKDAARKAIATINDQIQSNSPGEDNDPFECTLRGEDLRIGGEGMVEFYDRILPGVVNDICKPFGLKTGTTKLAIDTKFRIVDYGSEWKVERASKNGWTRESPNFDSEQSAMRWIESIKRGIVVHFVDITPEMRRVVLDDGQPRFGAVNFDIVVKTAAPASLDDKAKRHFQEACSVDDAHYLLRDGTGIDIGHDDHRIVSVLFNGKVPKGYYNSPGSGVGYMLAFMGQAGAVRTRMSPDRTLSVSFINPPTSSQIRAIMRTSADKVYADRFGKHYENIDHGVFDMPWQESALRGFLEGRTSDGDETDVTASRGRSGSRVVLSNDDSGDASIKIEVDETGDEEYLQAAERGDVETCGRLVGEAAQKAGYATGPVWHGSQEDEFNSFSNQHTAYGFYFAPDRNAAEYYGPAKPFYLRIEKLADFSDYEDFYKIAEEAVYDDGKVRNKEKVQAWIDQYLVDQPNIRAFVAKCLDVSVDTLDEEWDSWDDILSDLKEEWDSAFEDAIQEAPKALASLNLFAPLYSKEIEDARESHENADQSWYLNYQDDFVKAAVRMGYDGVFMTDPNSQGSPESYVVFEPHQIKSAEAIVKDDQGNVVPLSRRFDGSSEDVRFKRDAPVIRTADFDVVVKTASLPLGIRRVSVLSPDVARALSLKVELPQDESFRRAVEGTPGSKITDDGLEIELTRNQHPDQEGEPSARSGVFYQPSGSPSKNPYRGKGGWGGSETIRGTTIYKKPLFVKGSTGGRVPERAFDMVKGKGSYARLDEDVMKLVAASMYGVVHPMDVALLLDKHGGDRYAADTILYVVERQGGVGIRMAIQENIIAHAVRDAGYDAIIGWNKRRDGTPFISEVFDLREITYPGRDSGGDVHEMFTAVDSSFDDDRQDMPAIRTADFNIRIEGGQDDEYANNGFPDSSWDYFTIGHADGKNLIWIWLNGKLEVKSTVRNHYKFWPEDVVDNSFHGRYEKVTGKCSIVIPTGKAFRGIPKILQNLLFEEFGSNTQLTHFAQTTSASDEEHLAALATASFDVLVRTASDDEYLQAAERGDVETCGQLVVEAAQRAGYTTGPVWHGTKGSHTDFVPSRGGEFGSGIYLADSPDTARMFGSFKATDDPVTVHKLYIKLDNPFITSNRDEPRGIGVKQLMRRGHDGVIGTTPSGQKQYVVFSASQIKLVDPILRDSSGDIIPLSRRFDPSSSNIRFKQDAPVIRTADFNIEVDETADSEYLQAAERGDIDVCQRMTDEAAKSAGLIKAYRAENAGRGVMTDAIPGGIYFFPELQTAELWAGGQGNVFAAYLEPRKLIEVTEPEGSMTRGDADTIVRRYWPDGDGIAEIVVFSPSQIQSADPVVKDSSGNVVPLSRRFNSGAEEMKFDHSTPTITASSLSKAPKPVFLPNTKFIHMSSDASALIRDGWDSSKEGSVGGSLYKGISVTLPDYVDSWIEIARLGGTTPVKVTLPPGKKLINFYATFGSMDASENQFIRDWASRQGRWKETTRIQMAQYDEDGEVSGWMDDDPDGYDEGTETRDYTGFESEDNEDIYAAYIEQEIPQACGVWYWDADDPFGLSAPQGVIMSKFAKELKFSQQNERNGTGGEFDIVVTAADGGNRYEETQSEWDDRLGQSPDDYEGKAPRFDWYAADNTGVKTRRSIAAALGVPADEFVYRAMVDLSDLHGVRVEKEDAKDLREGKGEIDPFYVREATGLLDEWSSFEQYYRDEKFEQWRDYLPWAWGEEYDDGDVETLAREMEARATEDSYPEEEFSISFKTAFPPIEVTRTVDGRLVVNDGNHRVDIWQQQGFDKAPAWVNDEMLRSRGIEREAASFDMVVKDGNDQADQDVSSKSENVPVEPAAQEYRGEHQPASRDGGCPLHDLTAEGIYPADVYSRPFQYTSGDPDETSAMSIARRYRGRPNDRITVYRAVPKDAPRVINVGDWVSLTRKYAVDHGKGNLNNSYQVVQKLVSARDLFTDGGSIAEWGYDPQPRDLEADARRRERGRELYREKHKDQVYVDGRGWFDKNNPDIPDPMTPEEMEANYQEKIRARMSEKGYDWKDGQYIKRAKQAGQDAKLASMRGEWWIIDGQVSFADGDIGDIDHTGMAIQHAANIVMDAVGADYNGEYGILSEHQDIIKEQMEEDGFQGSIQQYLIEKLEGHDDPEGIVMTAYGSGDPRDYAIRKWGWQRVAGNDVETMYLSAEALSSIVSGLSEIMENEGIDYDDMRSETFSIEVRSSKTVYHDVPYSVLSEDGISGLRGYGMKYASLDFDVTVKTAGTSSVMTGHRNKASSPDGQYGTFYSLYDQQRDVVTKTIQFDNLLEVPQSEVAPFDGLPSEGLACKWFRGYNFSSKADELDMESGELMDAMVALEAVKRGHDGIRFGDMEFVDLRSLDVEDLARKLNMKEPVEHQAGRGTPDGDFKRWFGGRIKGAFKKDHIIGILLDSDVIGAGPCDGGCRVLAKALTFVEPEGKIVTMEHQVRGEWYPTHYGYEFRDGGIVDGNGYYANRNSWMRKFIKDEVAPFARTPVEPHRVSEGELDSDEVPEDPSAARALADAIARHLSDIEDDGSERHASRIADSFDVVVKTGLAVPKTSSSKDLVKTAVRVDRGDLVIDERETSLARTIEIQGDGIAIHVDFRIARPGWNGDAHIIVSGGFDEPAGPAMDFLEALMTHPEISGKLVPFSEGRSGMMDMLGGVLGKRFTENPDKVMAVPVLWGIWIGRNNGHGIGGYWHGIFKDKETAERYARNYRVSMGHNDPKSAVIKRVPPKKRLDLIKKTHEYQYIMNTDITLKEKELMLNSEAEMLPDGIKVSSVPTYGVIANISNPKAAMDRLIDLCVEIAQPMVEEGVLDFISAGNTFGKPDPKTRKFLESRQFAMSKSNHQDQMKSAMEALLYVADVVLTAHPKCRQALGWVAKEVYETRTGLSGKELKPVKGDITSVKELRNVFETKNFWYVVDATLNMNNQVLDRLEHETNKQNDVEYYKKFEADENSSFRTSSFDVVVKTASEPSATDSPEFKAWFSGSKVVDDDGKPMRVYHGTPSDFSVFDENIVGGVGFYFAKHPEIASDYTGENIHGDKSRNIMPVYLSIKNPLTPGEYSKKYLSAAKGGNPRKDAIQMAIKDGYDGVIGNAQVIAFRPDQIKSATGNRGLYDPLNPDVTASGNFDIKVTAGSLGAINPGKLTSESFSRGYCPEFAIAMHETTGWPIVVFNEIIRDGEKEYAVMGHAACRSPDGQYADVHGLRDGESVAVNMLGSDVEPLNPDEWKIENSSVQNLEKTQNIDKAIVDKATSFIRMNGRLWNIEDGAGDSDFDIKVAGHRVASLEMDVSDSDAADSGIVEKNNPEVNPDEGFAAYHGTPRPGFDIFALPVGHGKNETSSMGIWFTSDPSVASEFAEDREYWMFGDGYDLKGVGGVYPVRLNLRSPKIYERAPASPDAKEKTKELRQQEQKLSVEKSIMRGGDPGYDEICRRLQMIDDQITMLSLDTKNRDAFEVMMDDRDRHAEYIGGVKGIPGFWRKRYIATNAEEANRAFVAELKAQGHDGIILKETIYDAIDGKVHDQYVVFDPSAVKSTIGSSTIGTEKTAGVNVNWFGSSKVVGVNGQPLVVYHGSKNPMMEKFDNSYIGTGITRGQGERPDYGGFFFTSDPENASFFADYKNLKELSLDLVSTYGGDEEWFYAASDDEGEIVLNGGPFRNSKLAENAGRAHTKRYNASLKKGEDMFVRGYYLKIENPLEVSSKEMVENRWSPPDLIPIAKDAGHDGIIIRNFQDGYMPADTYVVFDGSQIKATGKSVKAASALPGTPEELSEMEFDGIEGSGHSITPKQSFEWRNMMSEGPESSGHETLADLASYDDQWRLEDALGKGWDASFDGTPNSLSIIPAIKANSKIRVFRATEHGGILPGSYVTESLSYANMHARMQFENVKWHMYSIEAYPDELVTIGDPHEFIYVPRNPQTAHERMKKGTTPSRRSSSGVGEVKQGKLNLDTGVDDAKAKGKLDTQLFPDCAGTKFDRDVVGKHRRRLKVKRNRRVASVENWKEVAGRMIERDRKAFSEWVQEIQGDVNDLDYFRDFVDEKYSIEIRDDGLTEINWRVDDDVKRVVGDEDIVVFHMTSTALLPKIRREGLRKSKKDANRFGQPPAGVYVSLHSSGVEFEGYAYNATAKHGGEPIMLEIRTKLSSMLPDPDDADISSGAYQYVLPSVPPSDILNLGGNLRTANAEPRDLIGELIEEMNAEYDAKWIPMNSSAIREVAYFEPLGMLEFKMKNFKEYSYMGVPKSEFEALLAVQERGESVGRWFSEFNKRHRAQKSRSSATVPAFGIKTLEDAVFAVSKTATPPVKTADHWGKAGSGILYHCPDDQTVMLLERSSDVEDPGLWGIPGGAIKGTDGYYDENEDEGEDFDEETLRSSAHTETEEEIGHLPEGGRNAGSVTIPFGNFKFTTFLVEVDSEQKMAIMASARLNWESTDIEWFPISRLPRNVHPGVNEAVRRLFGGFQ